MAVVSRDRRVRRQFVNPLFFKPHHKNGHSQKDERWSDDVETFPFCGSNGEFTRSTQHSNSLRASECRRVADSAGVSNEPVISFLQPPLSRADVKNLINISNRPGRHRQTAFPLKYKVSSVCLFISSPATNGRRLKSLFNYSNGEEPSEQSTFFNVNI